MKTFASYPYGDISTSGTLAETILQRLSTFGNISRMKRKPLREVLADNVRDLMRASPAVDTQVKLAKRAGISQSSVARVLAGNVDTQIGIVAALAEAFGLTPGRLLDEAGGATELQLDRERFAKLPAIDRAKIQSYIDFVMAQPSTDGADALAFGQKLTQTQEQEDRARRAAQRPTTKDSLSINENKDQRNPGAKPPRKGVK